MIDEILAYNRAFVTNKGYKPYTTSKYPDRKLAIVTCMDTRLIELLPAVRSLLIAIYELNVEEIMIIGHTDCGVGSIDIEAMLKKMEKRGISETVIRDLGYCGIDFNKWLGGFDDVEISVKESVSLLRRHPLLPKNIEIHGLVMDSRTGALSLVEKN